MVSRLSFNYSGIEVFEVHNAESVSSINKFDNKGYQCFTATIFDELKERGDITKINISNIETLFLKCNQLTEKIEEILKNIYISKDSRIVTPYHKLIGQLREIIARENKRV